MVAKELIDARWKAVIGTALSVLLALVSAFAAMAVSLVTIPIYMAFGRPGLAGLVLLAVLCCGYLARRISHLGRQR